MPAKTSASTIKKATGTKKTKKTKSTAAKVGRPPKHKELLFSLDIGTRSVIGIVAEKKDAQLKILATHRQEHTTRAMTGRKDKYRNLSSKEDVSSSTIAVA